jgi:glycosyltransferase involved in cell wall biosynthesis
MMKKQKKRILVTASCFPRWENDIAGGGSFVYDISKLIADEFDVYVLVPQGKDSDKESHFGGVTIIRYPYFLFKRNNLINENGLADTLSQNKLYYLFVPYFLVSQLIAIIKCVKKYNIETIHAHWLIPQGIVACVYKKIFNRKVSILCTSHGSDLNKDFGFIGKLFLKFTFKNIDSLTVVSQNLKDKVIAQGYSMAIEVIPMGIDTKIFIAEESKKTRDVYNLKGRILLFIGNYVEVKGIEYLLRALPAILTIYPDITLLLVGDGILKPKFIKIAEELDIIDRIIFTGFIANEELPNYYSSADIVIMPSLSEGCPVVMAEAFACSSIVISSDIPAFQSHITDGITGFKVPVKNSKAIAEKVIEVLNENESLQAIRENARKYAIDHFDWEIVRENYIKLLLN